MFAWICSWAFPRSGKRYRARLIQQSLEKHIAPILWLYYIYFKNKKELKKLKFVITDITLQPVSWWLKTQCQVIGSAHPFHVQTARVAVLSVFEMSVCILQREYKKKAFFHLLKNLHLWMNPLTVYVGLCFCFCFVLVFIIIIILDSICLLYSNF